MPVHIWRSTHFAFMKSQVRALN